MIDTHLHLLPGVDDGPENLASALALAQQAVDNGVRHAVVTPHVDPDQWYTQAGKAFRKAVLHAYSQTQSALAQAGIPLTITLGYEVYLTPELPSLVREYPELTLAGARKYILVELPRRELPVYTNEVLFALAVQGVQPIIAHPERNAVLATRADLLADLNARGVMLQLTTPSISGRGGAGLQKLCRSLIAAGIVQLVASDAHDVERRPYTLKLAMQLVKRWFGPELTQRIFAENPERILTGAEIQSLAPQKRRRIWGLGLLPLLKK